MPAYRKKKLNILDWTFGTSSEVPSLIKRNVHVWRDTSKDVRPVKKKLHIANSFVTKIIQDWPLLAYKFWLSKNVVIHSLPEENLPFFDLQSQSRSESKQAIHSGFIEIERPFVKWVLSIARVYTQSFCTENVVRFIISEYAGNVDGPDTGSKILPSADLFVFRVVELVSQEFLEHHQGTCQSAVPFSFLSYMRQFDLKTKHLKKIYVSSMYPVDLPLCIVHWLAYMEGVVDEVLKKHNLSGRAGSERVRPVWTCCLQTKMT